MALDRPSQRRRFHALSALTAAVVRSHVGALRRPHVTVRARRGLVLPGDILCASHYLEVLWPDAPPVVAGESASTQTCAQRFGVAQVVDLEPAGNGYVQPGEQRGMDDTHTLPAYADIARVAKIAHGAGPQPAAGGGVDMGKKSIPKRLSHAAIVQEA